MVFAPPRLRLVLAAMLLASAWPQTVRAQRIACTARHPMVDAVAITGNARVSTSDLEPVIRTERTGLWRRWFGWNTGTLTCLDTIELRSDAANIAAFYDSRGYAGTRVQSTVTRRGDKRAQVTFVVREGNAVRINSVVVAGLPAEAADARAIQQRLLRTVYDDSVLKFVRDSVQQLVKEAGFAHAREPLDSSRRDTTAHRGTVHFVFRPGPVTRIGAIAIRFSDSTRPPALSADAVRALLRVHSGDRLDSREVATSQRDLYATELYRTVRIDNVPVDSTHDSLVVQLAEGDRRRLRTTVGWATLDCFRASARLVEQNLANTGNRLEVTAKLSKIGMAHPFGGFSGLCASETRDDPFSRNLNYYAGATLNLRGVLGAQLRPSLTLFTERRSEPFAYQQQTDVGVIAAVARELGTRLVGTAQYQYVDGKTVADRSVSCTTFGFCRLEDLTSFVLPSPVHTIGGSLARNPLLPTSDPDHGYRWQVELRYGHTQISRILPLDFAHIQGEAASYRALGDNLVLATRVQAGFVFAPSDRSVLLPPQERFYAGGQNTVRGFGQNQLGPGSYIVDSYVTRTLADGTVVGEAGAASSVLRIAPSGGNAMWVANIELRTRRGWPADLLHWAAFVDAGQVWNSNDVFSVLNAKPRVTPGLGVRLVTPIGPFRVDVGYNPYPLASGPAFYVVGGDLANGVLGTVTCVSPGTADPLPGSTHAAALSCPVSYTPLKRGGLLPRLAFHFSIGNAF